MMALGVKSSITINVSLTKSNKRLTVSARWVPRLAGRVKHEIKGPSSNLVMFEQR